MDENKLKELVDKSNQVAPTAERNPELELFIWKKTIESFSPKVQELFDEYLEIGDYPDYEYQGWSLKRIAQHTNYGVLEVFNEMNKIMTDDEYCRLFGFINFGRK